MRLGNEVCVCVYIKASELPQNERVFGSLKPGIRLKNP
jgi:hypothetical protein